VFSFNPKNGSSGLNRHRCKAKGLDEALQEPASESKKRVTKKLSLMCIKDSRPFEAVYGEGFLDVCQELLDIQYESKGKLNARSIVCHPTTVSRNIHGIRDSCVLQIINLLEEIEEADVGFAFSTDLWTDSSTSDKVKFNSKYFKRKLLFVFVKSHQI
jgi:hypothetical protein